MEVYRPSRSKITRDFVWEITSLDIHNDFTAVIHFCLSLVPDCRLFRPQRAQESDD